MFTYGFQGKASYQLISMAVISRQATQTIEYDCNNGQSSAVGWNGATLPVTETKSLLQQVEVSNCKVRRGVNSTEAACSYGSSD